MYIILEGIESRSSIFADRFTEIIERRDRARILAKNEYLWPRAGYAVCRREAGIQIDGSGGDGRAGYLNRASDASRLVRIRTCIHIERRAERSWGTDTCRRRRRRRREKRHDRVKELTVYSYMSLAANFRSRVYIPWNFSDNSNTAICVEYFSFYKNVYTFNESSAFIYNWIIKAISRESKQVAGKAFLKSSRQSNQQDHQRSRLNK